MSEDPKDELEAERPSLETIIESWLQKHGEEKVSKAGVPYWAIRSQDYRDVLSSLLNSILYAGYTEADARSATLLRLIHESMTKEITDSKKLKAWRDIITQVWKFVVAKQFANLDLIKPATNFDAEVKETKAIEDEAPPKPYVSPKGKLDPTKFEGYGDAEVVYDENFAKLFEALKDE
jgi:hypothetical protein